MKKIFALIALVSLILVMSVQAKPFIVCDQSGSDPDHYLVVMNTGDEVESPYPLHFDLADISPGDYVVTVRAVYDLWGTSAPSVPLEFTKPVLIPPITRLVGELQSP